MRGKSPKYERETWETKLGVMFKCLCSCDIHIEVTDSLDTDSFLLTLQSFIGKRCNIRQMRSDNGSNFSNLGKLKNCGNLPRHELQ